MDRSMIDTTSWGVLIEKTSEEAWELISKMHVDSFRRFNEVIHSNIEKNLSELTSLIKQVALE
jgi:succinyl-CoA synthetase beta subunit